LEDLQKELFSRYKMKVEFGRTQLLRAKRDEKEA